jgi:hypothetical protein
MTAHIEGEFPAGVAFNEPGAPFDGQEVLPLLNRVLDEVIGVIALLT